MISLRSADIREDRIFNVLNHSLVNDAGIQQWYRNIKLHIYFYRLHFTNYTLTTFGRLNTNSSCPFPSLLTPPTLSILIDSLFNDIQSEQTHYSCCSNPWKMRAFRLPGSDFIATAKLHVIFGVVSIVSASTAWGQDY